MSTRGTVYVAVNGVNAGVTKADEAKSDILNHIGELVRAMAQDTTVDRLDQLSEQFGFAFVVRAGKIDGITFC